MATRTKKPMEVNLHLAPLARCTLVPAGADGVVTIGQDVYRIAYIDDGRDILGYRLTKRTGGHTAGYDVPHSLESCECMGFHRHGRCKHLKALAELRSAGKIA